MSSFIENIRRAREAAKATPPVPTRGAEKPVSAMTEAELDQEDARLRTELHKARQEDIAAKRNVVEAATARPRFLPKRRRPTWR